ncbi:MAG: hypothetical protein C0434_10535 [Xanthomonadaceae bacterium]|nr:hypothetical protein [Xanthomonadaceae bacterium]
MATVDRLRGLLRASPGGRRVEKLQAHESFFTWRRSYYLKLALALTVAISLVYLVHDPAEGPSGSTWLGYGLGTAGAGLIVWLSWLGVRKRSFTTARGPIQGWLSAHVYLGLLLLLIGTLHTGFQLGFNIHTLAYVLMVLVIASGIYGAVAYGVLPARITLNRKGGELRSMLVEIEKLNDTALSLADRIDPEAHAVVVRSIAKIRLGGSAWEQLTGRYRSSDDARSLDSFFAMKKQQFGEAVGAARARPQAQSKPQPPPAAGMRSGTTMFVIDHIFDRGSDKAAVTLNKLLQVIADRKELVERVNVDITLRARLSVWLYLHVPLTVLLLVALLAHVLSVFLLW